MPVFDRSLLAASAVRVVLVDLNTWINIVLVLATIAVVVFAWQTVREARKATDEERKTVVELQKLVQAAQQTAASSASTMEAARETAEISKAARDADRRNRQRQQFVQIQRLVQEIRIYAQNTEGTQDLTRPTWKCAQQADLKTSLASAAEPLPYCSALAAAAGAKEVMVAADAASTEIADVFRKLDGEIG